MTRSERTVDEGLRPDRCAVIRQGSVPMLNGRLRGLVEGVFPEYGVDDIDVLAPFGRLERRSATTLLRSLVESAPRLLQHRVDPKKMLMTSAAFEDAVRRRVAETVSADTHAFTLQSQSLFGARVPDVPNFVYTDHAHLANLSYPGFDTRKLLARSFLERERLIYHSATAVFVRSQNIHDALISVYGVDPARVEVVGVGPNVDPETERGGRTWHGGRILFVGMDFERKGGPTLLDAFRGVRNRHPRAQLDLVGCTPDVDGQPGVVVHGRLPTAAVGSLMREADVFCLPTLAEPFGVVCIEAMLTGLPVIATRLGAMPDFVIPGQTGALVEPNDVDGLANAMQRLLDDPEESLRLGTKARLLADARYRWDPVMAAISDGIRRRLGGIADGGST